LIHIDIRTGESRFRRRTLKEINAMRTNLEGAMTIRSAADAAGTAAPAGGSCCAPAPVQATTCCGGTEPVRLAAGARGHRREAPSSAELDRLSEDLSLLAHPVRLRLLAQLAAGGAPVCVCDLEAGVPVKQPTVSHHLKQLRLAGLVESEKRGPWAYYSVRPGALGALRTRLSDGLAALAGGSGTGDDVTGHRAGTGRGVTVRPAVSADADAILGLLQAADLPGDGVVEQLESGFVVAQAGGAAVGAAALERYGNAGLLRSVVVAPGWRGRGVGEALVRERIATARSEGLTRLFLLTTTAAAWFPRLGFAPVERDTVPSAVRASPEFAGICPSTATVMELRLAGTPAELPAAELRARVRDRYGASARAAARGEAASCCGGRGSEWNPITSDLYEAGEAASVPTGALLASLGCGNPTALASLSPGETVLDLGSGGGIDVLLSARRVGPTGMAYGLDMTDDMLALARSNQAKAGVANVEFLKGDIEAVPLPDASVDVVISNCVINLAADKSRVLREAFRVLRPGGRFAVSDVVARRAVAPALRRSMELWMGCVAGALEEQEYVRLLAAAGFTDISVEPTRIYRSEDAQQLLHAAGVPEPGAATASVGAGIDALDGAFMSAFVRATKPA
jgi:arsenite methyltransferase